MWTVLLPLAIGECESEDPETRQSGYEEITRLRDALGNFHGGTLAYPGFMGEIEMFLSLSTLCRNFLASTPDNTRLTSASEIISRRFADKYIAKTEHPTQTNFYESVRREVRFRRENN